MTEKREAKEEVSNLAKNHGLIAGSRLSPFYTILTIDYKSTHI
jgi:hypothetical protein